MHVHVHCRLFDINPKGSVPIIHDLEKDTWVPGMFPCIVPDQPHEHLLQSVSDGDVANPLPDVQARSHSVL